MLDHPIDIQRNKIVANVKTVSQCFATLGKSLSWDLPTTMATVLGGGGLYFRNFKNFFCIFTASCHLLVSLANQHGYLKFFSTR